MTRTIVRIINRLNVGGPAIHAILLTHAMNDRRYRTVLVKGSEHETEGDMMEMASRWGVSPVLVPEMGREVNMWDDLAALWKVLRILIREKPDIVHTHTAKAGAVGRTAVLLYRVLFPFSTRPVHVLHTYHGHVFHSYFSGWKTFLYRWIETVLGRFTTRIVTLSESLKRELVGYGIAPDSKIAVVPLGIDLSPFLDLAKYRGRLRSELNADEGAFLVGIVGRLVPIKGHSVFIKAAKIVSERPEFRDKNIQFLVVGDGILRRSLESEVEGLGLRDRVRFLGFRTDLNVIYADLDLLVLSSLNEGTPVSIIESLCSGVPVVASGVGGVPDLVRDRVTGLLVPPSDPARLAEAMAGLIRDPDLRASLGKNGRSSVYPHFHYTRLVDRLDRLYESL
jgi:glycosyltransferase involved in cell wall biosynthesis